MDPLMQLTANEARLDRTSAIANARIDCDNATAHERLPKFHVVSFRSRAKAVALREFALKEQVYFSIARRGAVYARHDYDQHRIASVRRRFESWWRRTRIEEC